MDIQLFIKLKFELYIYLIKKHVAFNKIKKTKDKKKSRSNCKTGT